MAQKAGGQLQQVACCGKKPRQTSIHLLWYLMQSLDYMSQPKKNY